MPDHHDAFDPRYGALLPVKRVYVPEVLALLLLHQGRPPDLYLIASTAWRNPQGPFVSRDYPGLKSPPEWGINVSGRWMEALERYRFERVVAGL